MIPDDEQTVEAGFGILTSRGQLPVVFQQQMRQDDLELVRGEEASRTRCRRLALAIAQLDFS